MLSTIFRIMPAVLLAAAPASGSKGFSIGLGTEYTPSGKVEYGNPPSQLYEFYDNMSVESGVYYNFESGFRTGVIASLFSKSIQPGNTSTSKISFWGVGFLSDYEYEITETGTTRIVLGMDSGFSKFKDTDNFNKRTDNSFWIAGFGGVRYFFSSRYFFEFDYRMKWQEFILERPDDGSALEKTFRFSGSNLRLGLGYGFFPSRNSGEE